ncbi:hypothetical protein SLEP1_g20756 [Rubroshorea leprosula]|uniref:Uncharacterized protein n=1 Tax=Rubroshorea leprosula TaxID=152421 RepID=A0AAV5JCV8_9ROSI|nr:hypothetical protein SLEP1_g20756 [Rubroshorea leprosula]
MRMVVMALGIWVQMEKRGGKQELAANAYNCCFRQNALCTGKGLICD